VNRSADCVSTLSRRSAPEQGAGLDTPRRSARMETYMSHLFFDYEWNHQEDVRGDELKATWASLRIILPAFRP